MVKITQKNRNSKAKHKYTLISDELLWNPKKFKNSYAKFTLEHSVGDMSPLTICWKDDKTKKKKKTN
jgi:hypothetical protein